MPDAVTPTLAEMLEEILTSRLVDVHVALPGTVQAYNADKQTATIELGVHRVLQDEDGNPITEALPVLENVVVAFQRSKTFFVAFPLAAGDTGTVLFSEASIDQWLSRGGAVSPGDERRHSLTGGQFIPGITPTADRLADSGLDVDMGAGRIGGVQARFRAAALEVVRNGAASAPQFVALANLVDDFIGRFDTLMRTTWIPVPMDGGLALQTAYKLAFISPPVSTAAVNLKADTDAVPLP